MFRCSVSLSVAVLLSILATASDATACQKSTQAADPQHGRLSLRDFVTLEVRPHVRFPAGTLTIADVASVTCLDSDLRRTVEMVEICEINDVEHVRKLTLRTFQSRLVLAGLTLDQVRFRGKEECVVELGEPEYVTDKQIELEAQKVLCQVMGLAADDLNVQLQTAMMHTIAPELQKMDGLIVKVVPPLKPSLGNASLNVQFWKEGQLLLTRVAAFSIRKRFRVAVAKASLSREYSLDSSAVTFEDRFLGEPVDELTPDQIQGRSVKAVVTAGAVIQVKDLQASKTGKAVAVRKGDFVKVIATNGRLRLQLINVEAMADGGVGETIELKNRESGKTFAAQITGPGSASVRF